MNRQPVRLAADLHDRLEVPQHVVRDLLVEMRNDHVRRAGGEQGVPVGLGSRRDLGSDQSPGARAIVDYDLLSEHAKQPVGNDAYHGVCRAAGCERNDHAHRLGRIGLGMSDRANQVVLGVFVGVFVYCVLVLRTIRNGDEGFVPGASILIAIALALTGIAFLIFFIHHTATSIQVSEIAARIWRETMNALRREVPEPYENTAPVREIEAWFTGCAHVQATATGYIQRVDIAALIRWAKEHGRALWVEKAVGEFVVAGECLARVKDAEPVQDDAACGLREAFTVNTYRDVTQDPAFGLQQLVEIALKALSPGVNDTGTARDALNYITAIMRE